MSRRVKESSEYQNYPVAHSPTWLGGMFEVAGTMSFQVQKAKEGYIYATPYLAVQSQDHQKILNLQQFAGGTARRGGVRSFTWWAGGNTAVWLAGLMRPFAPRRSTIIEGFLKWQEGVSNEARVITAVRYRNQQPSAPSVQSYVPLIQDARFVAGVLDGRGSMMPTENYKPEYGYGYVTDELAVNSMNEGLLRALVGEYGGSVIRRTRHEGFTWRVAAQNDLQRLANVTQGHFHLRQIF